MLHLQLLMFSTHQIKWEAKDGQIALGTSTTKPLFLLVGKLSLNCVYQYVKLVSISTEQSVNSDILKLFYFHFPH